MVHQHGKIGILPPRNLFLPTASPGAVTRLLGFRLSSLRVPGYNIQWRSHSRTANVGCGGVNELMTREEAKR